MTVFVVSFSFVLRITLNLVEIERNFIQKWDNLWRRWR